MNDLAYVTSVLDNRFSGEFNTRLERDFADLFGVDYGIGVNSGTSALTVALYAVGVQAGDEVIVPGYTFASPAFAVLHLGATPVFADIEADTWNISASTIHPLITEKTKAIVVVHLYGLPANMPEIMQLANAYDLEVIEDCAECLLGEIHDGYGTHYAGTYGDMATFSFERTKQLAAGGGGMIITDNEKYATRARKFSILGYANYDKEALQHPSATRHYSVGYNFKLPELCAAVVLAQLEKVDEIVYRRTRCGHIFHSVVSGFKQCMTQRIPNKYRHVYWTYVFRLPKHHNNKLWESFRKEFIDRGGHSFYAGWLPVLDEPFFQKHRLSRKLTDRWFDSCPTAQKLQPGLVCLKTNFETEQKVKKEAEILEESLGVFL